MRTRGLVISGVLVALAVGLFLWRYHGTTAAVDSRTSEGSRITSGWRPVDHVPLAPVSLSLPALEGARQGIPDQGTFLVNLWASWCGPCRQELPWLRQLAESGRVKVLGITRDNLRREALDAVDRYRLPYPNFRDVYGDFSASLSAVIPPRYLPSSFIVVDGEVTWAHIGPFRSYADLRSSVVERL